MNEAITAFMIVLGILSVLVCLAALAYPVFFFLLDLYACIKQDVKARRDAKSKGFPATRRRP